MTNKTSFLFSLKDNFEYTPKQLNKFIVLGDAPMGRFHVIVFYRRVVSSVLSIDCDNAIKPSSLCTVYNIINSRGTIYGALFVLTKDRFKLENNRLVVTSSNSIEGDFSLYPYNNDKSNVMIYRDSNHNLLVNIHDESICDLVVLDE